MSVLFSLWQEYRIFARLSLPEWQISSPQLSLTEFIFEDVSHRLSKSAQRYLDFLCKV